MAYFNTNTNTITSVKKKTIQGKCWDKKCKPRPRLFRANGNIWSPWWYDTAAGFRQRNYIIRFVLFYRDKFETPEAMSSTDIA